MIEFNAKIEVKNGKIYITSDANYIEFDNFIWDNRDKKVGDIIMDLPF